LERFNLRPASVPDRLRVSLKFKLALLLIVIVGVTAAASALTAQWFGNALLGWLLIVAAALLPVLWLSSRVMRPIQQMLRASQAPCQLPRRGF